MGWPNLCGTGILPVNGSHDEGIALSEVASKELSLEKRSAAARERLDAQTREIVAWHFDPKTGCPFWLDYAKKLNWACRNSRIRRDRRRAAGDLRRW